MSFSLSARKLVVGWCSLVAIPVVVLSQNSFVPSGGEFSPTGKIPGDQVHPAASFTTNGGYVAWEDYFIDGKGIGIGAMHLNNDLTGSGVAFRVDSMVSADQENAHVSMLNNGGAVFAWQGGKQGRQHIFARFLSPSNSWLTGDVLVNSDTNKFQNNPVTATLLNGNVAVVYVSVNQAADGSMADVYLQMFAPDGTKIGGEVLVNQFTANNQRTPAIAALADGKLAVAWVSEQQRWTDASNGVPSVDIFARVFDSTGNPVTSEFLVNSTSSMCAVPDLTGSSDGGFMATWMARDLAVRNNGWDISVRRFSGAWVGGNETRVNIQLFGDQSSPKLRRSGSTYLDVWNSPGQDGSKDGVFARYLNDDGSVSGNEFQVNSTTFGSQMHQTLASDGAGRFLAVWTSYDSGASGYNLYSQIYWDPAVAAIGTNSTAFNMDPNTNPDSVDRAPINESVNLPAIHDPILPTNAPPVTESFADVKGTYNGLVYDPNNVTAGNSGYITITASASKAGQGSFSAKLQMGGRKYSFSGPFDASGAYTGNVGSYQVSLQIDLTGGDRITGQISDGTWTASVLANRVVFNKSNQSSLRGTYTVVVPSPDSTMGHGIGTVTVDALGRVKWNLTLADGTKVGESTTLSKAGAWPLYSQPYKTGGVTIGWMQFAGAPEDGFEGQCVWTKPSGASGVYSQGITNGVQVSGALFQAPPRSFRNFGNSTVILNGGGLSSPVTNSVMWGSDNKVVAGSSMKLSVNASSGLFQGTLAVGPGKAGLVPFQGVLFEKNNVGLGFFLGSGQSGTVSFTPNN